MDLEAKKQRRRSIRNLRKSASFIPPSVNYGSAWIGDSQETNICNLVQSLEELSCRDDADQDESTLVIGLPQHNSVQHDDDEACDGFSFRQPIKADDIPSCSNGKTQQTPALKAAELSSNGLVSREPNINSVEPSSKKKSCDMSSWAYVTTDDHACSRERDAAEKSVQCPENCQPNSQSIEKQCDYKECCYEQYSLIPEAHFTGSSAVDKHECAKEADHGHSVLSEIVSETDYNSMQNERSSISQKSLNNSMSPEFGDFCPNSAQSSPSSGPMNQAINSFFDISSTSFFDLSFSPMNNRPNTPSSSCGPQFANSNSSTKPTLKDDTLRKSISDIILSFDEPIISADPITSIEIAESDRNGDVSPCIPKISSSLPFVSCDFPTTDRLSGDLDRTYTIEEQSVSEGVGNAELSLKQAATQSEEFPCPQPPIAEHELQIENMTVLDFDFAKPKSKRRTSSLFTPIENPHVCHSFHFEQMPFVSQEQQFENAIDSSYNDKSNTKEKVCDVNTVEGNNPNLDSEILPAQSNVSDVVISDTLSNGIGVDTVSKSLPQNVNISQSPSQSTLVDCGNFIECNKQVKTKKQRRKSNKLALLLQESERFVVNQNQPSTSNDELSLARLQGGNHSDKENDVNDDVMDAEESDASVPSNSGSRERNARTRRNRKSWDFRKESKPQLSSFVEPLVLEDCCNTESGNLDLEVEELQILYGKQKYTYQSPQPLETIKEISNEKTVFLKKKVRRYLNFGSVTEAKAKRRTKKALNVYRGRQCYFPITEQDFDRKMLDVQIALDSDLDFCLV